MLKTLETKLIIEDNMTDKTPKQQVEMTPEEGMETVKAFNNHMGKIAREAHKKGHKKAGKIYENMQDRIAEESENIKKDMQENPEKYIKGLTQRVNEMARQLAQKNLQIRALEEQSAKAVMELQSEIKTKDVKLASLKFSLDAVSNEINGILNPEKTDD